MESVYWEYGAIKITIPGKEMMDTDHDDEAAAAAAVDDNGAVDWTKWVE